MNYFVNYRLYDGKPCNNYYTQVVDGITKYYDELYNELNEDGIKNLGLETLTIINDIPMNLTDFNGMPGSGKKMLGGAKKLITDPALIQNLIKEQKAIIDTFTKIQEIETYKQNAFQVLFNFSSSSVFGKKLNDLVKKENNDDKMTWSKLNNVNTKKTILKTFLDNNMNELYEELPGTDIDFKNINLSDLSKSINLNQNVNRGFTVPISDIQAYNYEININDMNISRSNDAVDSGEILYCFLKNIYFLLIQSNKSNGITQSKIIANNSKILKHIIDNSKILNDKYLIDKSFLKKMKDGKKIIINDIMTSFIKKDDTSNFQKYMYFFNKAVKCLNVNCYRPAKSGAVADTTKQRQECGKCTAYREKFYENRASHKGIEKYRPEGVKIIPKDKLIDGKKYFNLVCEILPVELIYEKFCYNNKNLAYWTGLDGKQYIRGKERGLNGTKYDPKMESILFYDKEEKEEINLYIPKYNEKKKRIEYVQYFCELNNSWDAYPSDITEIDHISGNHQDNRPENIQPLCKICHAMKTKLAQDKAETNTSISAIDTYFASLVLQDTETEKKKKEDSKKAESIIYKYDNICGYFYLQYSLFCRSIDYKDELIGITSKYTTDLMKTSPMSDVIIQSTNINDPSSLIVDIDGDDVLEPNNASLIDIDLDLDLDLLDEGDKGNEDEEDEEVEYTREELNNMKISELKDILFNLDINFNAKEFKNTFRSEMMKLGMMEQDKFYHQKLVNKIRQIYKRNKK